MIVQFRNEKVSNHGSIPIPIDCNVVAFIVFEEGFHQPIKRTKQVSSSKKTLNCPEVNTRFVYGMRQIGKCFSAGFKLCGTLNLPRLSKTAYTNHENKLMLVNSEVSELSMQKAASELLVLHPTKNKIVECGISVDGTWQRRGYSSMNGCVAALSVDTGKVVDIEI
ncbi:uncharacterized protein TNCV_3849151 [Trichonephila clavipes]|uniref:Mutator-like transposase domain-containing protein n=1 Tax=Trichonephila clavipes TaxID=2585209 RepID=A0A8X6RA61_TRICX|nr:uncharacterized protein TNCV_3849151 [Trichonephila clavipes]